MKMGESTNYDEYNRNNKLINNIRFNNRYNDMDNSLDTLRINNVQQNTNQNELYQNQVISQNENNNLINNNNFQKSNEYNMNNSNNKNMNDTLENNNRFNYNNNNNFGNNNVINNKLNEERSSSLNIPSNQNENNIYKSQDINIGLNEWVRNDLESRGLHVGRSVSPRSIRMSQMDKKKTLLENIQAQINLKKRSKLEELNKRKQEDAKYLQDMVIFYPFGRGGGGAPNRDKSGNVITYRRALISDPKYNFASINVDDDYDEVWNREKRIGRFYRNSPGSFNKNNDENYIQNNVMEMNEYNNIPNNYNNQQINNRNKRFQLSRSMNMDYNPEFNNNQFRMSRRTPDVNQNKKEISAYNELLLKLREQNELLKRQLEEEKENERIRKEREKKEEEEEEQKKLKKMKENEIEEKEDDIITEEENNNIYRNRIIEKEIIDPESIILDKNAIERINRSEIESRNKLNNEIYRLRAQMQDQQMLLYQQISNLKVEAEKANSQREEALREIERLKLQIYQDNKEDRQKRYIHHVIVTDDDKNIEKSIQTEQPKNNEDTLELNKLLKKNIDRLNYLEEIERLNAIRRSPPSNYELEYPKKNNIPEKEEEDDDLYEIEISKVHN